MCGTTGKRKACKNCSCGLAEELAAEVGAGEKAVSTQAKSSCGNVRTDDFSPPLSYHIYKHVRVSVWMFICLHFPLLCVPPSLSLHVYYSNLILKAI